MNYGLLSELFVLWVMHILRYGMILTLISGPMIIIFRMSKQYIWGRM